MKCFFVFLFLCSAFVARAGDTLDLAGVWRFRMDPSDVGEVQRWFEVRLAETVRLPGSMMENGKGDRVTAQTKWTASIYDSSWFFDPKMEKYRQPDNLKLPFWLTPPKHYLGAAWYQKDVTIPAGWVGRHVVLSLERPHSETTVWLDDKRVGCLYGFCTAQEFDLTGLLAPGHHVLTLRIDNRIKAINVGQDSHSLTDQTQGNWNGVVGHLLLTARAATWIEDVQVFPDLARRMAHVRVLVRSLEATGSGKVVVGASTFNTAVRQQTGVVEGNYRLQEGRDSLVVDLPMGEHFLKWDEFHPALYKLKVRLSSFPRGKGGGSDLRNGDRRVVEFGMREFRVEGTHFEVNGRPIHLRGMVENCVFPLTGYAPMDEAAWERIFRIARRFGLNHMRFHSYCPPEAAFEAADRLGFYLQPEGPSWANHGSSLGDGKPVDTFLFNEIKRLVRAYGNHPSFCMLAYGNEPRGGHQAEWLTRFVDYWKATDRRRVYTGADVGMNWPLVPDNDYMVKSGPRGLNWTGPPESITDYREVIGKFPVPYVTHEMGQWCVYPDFSEIPKYTGVYKAKNFELFQDILRGQGMGNEARRFLMASGKLQALCYKAEIEKSLRTPGSAGFQLLCLTDYPGQGTALVGVLNALWGEKGYINAREFSRFCNTTVPLARLPRFVYTNADTLRAAIELYNYGAGALHGVVIDWSVKDDEGKVLGHGAFGPEDVAIGSPIPVGAVSLPLRDALRLPSQDALRLPSQGIAKAEHIKLEVRVRGTAFANDWDCWVYPAIATATDAGSERAGVSGSVYYCTSLNDTARRILAEGGKVFLDAFGKVQKGKEVVMHFTPVFWNTSWFRMRPPHTLGILVDPASAVFADFPTSYHSDYQWWGILHDATPMLLEDFPMGFRPLVQPIDTWFLNRRLGLIFEARVGKGKIIVSSANLAADDPAARQLRYSVLKYMNSDRFRPVTAVGVETIAALFKIDRHALVERHDPVNVHADTLGSLTVGNGRFAFTVDVTGMQSFPEAYDRGIPLGTESQWGWHSVPDSGGYRFEQTLKGYNVHGRVVTYSVQGKNRAVEYFRANPQRLQLGNIGLELKKANGEAAGLGDLRDIHQRLDLWTGEIVSDFSLEGEHVHVSTCAHPSVDEVAFRVRSPLIAAGRLKVRLRFSKPTHEFTDMGDNWGDRGKRNGFTDYGDNWTDGGVVLDKNMVIPRELDTTKYFVAVGFGKGADTIGLVCRFGGPVVGDWGAVRAASAMAWKGYWTSGGAVDFSGSTDPRAKELERRIVLSQYLERVQEAGDYPPQETGLTYNSWYGKPHLEMHWWHDAHFALWGHPELLERSLGWYAHVEDSARAIARRQGYRGVRWQKMTDPQGRESPSSVGAFLIWQQPHFIYMAELCYRAELRRSKQRADSILKAYAPLVFATADFMASYAWFDPVRRRYVLGPALIPAQERFGEDTTLNPCFELAYWRWALGIAAEWRVRMGLGTEAGWERVASGLSALPQRGGLYLPAESAADAYTSPAVAGSVSGGNPRYRGDHPAVLATYGFLPATSGLDTATMHATYEWVQQHWDWPSTWGWDYPLMAMTATRLGLPEEAVNALLKNEKKNTYLPDGHNYQDERLRVYLPGNGGLLAAVALMCAGYDGCGRVDPGVPADGKWKVRWEGLNPMP